MTIELTIHRHKLTCKGQVYEARLNGVPVCQSLTPFFTAARALLDAGHSPDTPLAMKHDGATITSLRSTIGQAARLTVTEEDKKGLRIKKHRPPTFGLYQERGSVGSYRPIRRLPNGAIART